MFSIVSFVKCNAQNRWHWLFLDAPVDNVHAIHSVRLRNCPIAIWSTTNCNSDWSMPECDCHWSDAIRDGRIRLRRPIWRMHRTHTENVRCIASVRFDLQCCHWRCHCHGTDYAISICDILKRRMSLGRHVGSVCKRQRHCTNRINAKRQKFRANNRHSNPICDGADGNGDEKTNESIVFAFVVVFVLLVSCVCLLLTKWKQIKWKFS